MRAMRARRPHGKRTRSAVYRLFVLAEVDPARTSLLQDAGDHGQRCDHSYPCRRARADYRACCTATVRPATSGLRWRPTWCGTTPSLCPTSAGSTYPPSHNPASARRPERLACCDRQGAAALWREWRDAPPALRPGLRHNRGFLGRSGDRRGGSGLSLPFVPRPRSPASLGSTAALYGTAAAAAAG